MKRWKTIVFILLLGYLVPWKGAGRVFRVVGVRHGHLNTVGLPWDSAYQTTMTVNGRRNRVEVFSARFNEPVVEQLKSRFEQQGAAVELHRTADSTIGVATWPDREARMLVLSPGNQPNQMIFLLYPEARRSKEPRLPIPEYPGGKMNHAVRNEKTKTFCATLETADAVEQVQAFYAGALVADGWQPALPKTHPGAAPSKMTIFHKGNKVCCIFAKGTSGRLNRITLLVNEGGV